MWRHYLKFSLRQLSGNRFYSFISIAGLSVSMASCLLMILYLHGELTFDRHHSSPDRVYRVVFDNYLDLGKYATTPLPVGPALHQDLPEVEAMTRLAQGLKSLVRSGDRKFFETLTFVDTGFTAVFSLPFVAGDPQTALSEPNRLLISERYAKKYFGAEDPIGKTLEIGSTGVLNSVVAGVFKDIPQNSHFQFDIALPFSTFEKTFGPVNLWQQMPGNFTYLRLKPTSNAGQLARKLPGFVEKHLKEELPDWEKKYQMAVQPLLDIHLHSGYEREGASSGNLKTLYLLGVIALMVLFIAGINYINYATARFSKRSREVSIRKIVGASRSNLVFQFVGETLVTSLIAGGLALGLADLALPAFNHIAGKQYLATDLNQSFFFLCLAGISVLTGLFAGIFPALFLSGFRPSEALKGQFIRLSIANFSRKGLVVAQFTASIILIVSTLVVWRQMEFVRKSIRPNAGEQVAVFQINNKIAGKFETVKNGLSGVPGVKMVSAGSNVPTFTGDSWPVSRTLDGEKVQTENYAVENDFVGTMGYELLAGRELSSDQASDIQSGFVLNETAVKTLGLGSPEEALGQVLYWGGGRDKKKGTVVGVVKDFHFQSFHEKVEPALMQFSPYDWMTSEFVAIRFDPARLSEMRQSVTQIIAEIDPAWHADIRFLDDNFMLIHEKDRQQGRLFGGFGMLAIFISCLGLLGLAAFAAEQRAKEVGIRKVLGATITDITGLLSREFLKLVLAGIVIAVPTAWYLMDSWLQNFEYHIPMDWRNFGAVVLIAGAATLLIAGLTVSFQTVRAALSNPVDSLKNE